MATTLQQLLDDVTAYAADAAATPAPTIEDAAGALGHAGRALSRLSVDGLDAEVGSRREQLAHDLGAACHLVGSLWPAAGGPLTDAMGVAADVAGLARMQMGRSERWAACIEFAAAADECTGLVTRLVPKAAVIPLEEVRKLAAAVERDAQADPPGPGAGATLDRLIPVSKLPPGLTGAQVAAEASADLSAAIDRAERRGGLSLREFRAVTAAFDLSSRYVAAVATSLAGGDVGQPWRSAAVAWQVAGRATAAFEDGRREPRTEVIAWASLIPDALRRDLGPVASIDASVLSTRSELPELIRAVQQVANQVPLVADQLAATAVHWAGDGRLHAYARDLPQMDDMPKERVRDVIAGRRVQASGHDLDPLIRSITRAGSLSAVLADALNHAATDKPPTQPHIAATYAARVQAPGSAELLVSQARDVEQAMAANRRPFQSTSRQPDGPAPGRR